MIIWKIANTEIVDRTGIVEKQYVAVGKASTFVSLRPKGTIMVDGSTSIAPLME